MLSRNISFVRANTLKYLKIILSIILQQFDLIRK